MFPKSLKLKYSKRGWTLQAKFGHNSIMDISYSGLVTIAHYTNPLEAHIARGRLESEGIEAFVADENIIWANWLLSDAVGGVQLRVTAENSIRARRILNEIANSDILESDSDKIQRTSSGHCPDCGAETFQASTLPSRLAFLSIALVNFPLPFTRQLKHCRKCGHSRLDSTGSSYSHLTLFIGILINIMLLSGAFFLLHGLVKGIENYF